MRRLARTLLALFALGSFGLTLWAGWQVWQSPGLTPVRERTAQEIVAVTDRMMTREATADRMAALIAERLAEEPRNWVTLQALREVVAARGLAVDPAVLAAYDAAWEADSGVWATAAACGACFLDVSSCSLNTALLCKLPLAITPIDDLRGVTQAAWDYATDQEIDLFDAGVSMVGLAATGLILTSGGTSGAVKVGTATAKTARGMKLVSKPMEDLVVRAARDGVDWGGVSLARLVDDPASLVKPAAIKPLVQVTGDLGAMYRSTDAVTTLHLMRYIDDAGEARADGAGHRGAWHPHPGAGRGAGAFAADAGDAAGGRAGLAADRGAGRHDLGAGLDAGGGLAGRWAAGVAADAAGALGGTVTPMSCRRFIAPPPCPERRMRRIRGGPFPGPLAVSPPQYRPYCPRTSPGSGAPSCRGTAACAAPRQARHGQAAGLRPISRARRSIMRKFLVILDDTRECLNAMRFAAMRAAHTGGGVTILSIIPPEEFQQWFGVADVMRAEARERIEAHFEVFAKWMRDRQGVDPDLIIREGDPVAEILSLVKDTPEIGVLVLGAGAEKAGPGPLVTAMSRASGSLPVPITIVPGDMSKERLESIT